MRMIMLVLAVFASLVTAASGTTRIIVLPSDYAGSKEALIRMVGEAIVPLQPPDHVLVYSARPTVRQLADIHVPDEPNAKNPAWVKRKLGEQAAPVLRYIAGLPGAASAELPGNLMIPNVLDELARNVVPALPDKHAEVLLVGSLLYFDPRDDRWSMADRYYPSDGQLQADPARVPYSIAGKQDRLSGMTAHYCTPDGKQQFVSEEHEAAVKRFYALWTTGQSGRVGTFSDDLATCSRRFLAGETSGQPTYQPKRDAKPEMLRARLPIPPIPPPPGRPENFLSDQAQISRVPPTHTTGVAYIGLKWTVPADIDLFTRPDQASAWLYYGNVRSDKGFFEKDWRKATDKGQSEFVQYHQPIDLNTTEVAINLYSGTLPAGPEGVVRVWFDGKVYEAPFKLAARTGNAGKQPMSGPHWLRIDLRKVLGLASQ